MPAKVLQTWTKKNILHAASAKTEQQLYNFCTQNWNPISRGEPLVCINKQKPLCHLHSFLLLMALSLIARPSVNFNFTQPWGEFAWPEGKSHALWGKIYRMQLRGQNLSHASKSKPELLILFYKFDYRHLFRQRILIALCIGINSGRNEGRNLASAEARGQKHKQSVALLQQMHIYIRYVLNFRIFRDRRFYFLFSISYVYWYPVVLFYKLVCPDPLLVVVPAIKHSDSTEQ